MTRCLYITGIPGSGKSTLAGRIAKRTGRVLLSSHDLVELVDPAAIDEGRYADEAAMRKAYVAIMEQYHDVEFVMDGWPRNPGQGALLNGESEVIHLRCTHEVARERLARRARPDDTPELIEHRLREQEAVFNGDWIRNLAGWPRTLNTSRRTPADIENTVMLYLTGQRREVF